MWYLLLWSFSVYWYIRLLKNRCSWYIERLTIMFSAICESHRTVMNVFLPISIWLAMFKALKIAYSSVSTISLFFLKNSLLSFYQLINLSSQQMVATTWPWSNFHLSVHKTRPGWFFPISLSAFFLYWIIMSAWNDLSNIKYLTSSTLSTGSREWLTVSCHANHWLYRVARKFSVYKKVFSESFPGWKP